MPRPRPVRGCGRGFFGVRRLVGPLPGSGLRPGLLPGAAPPPGCGLRPPSGPPLAAPRVGGPRPSAACLGLSAPAAARRGPAAAPPAASLRRPGGRRLGRPRPGGPGGWPPPARASLPGGPRSAAAAPLGRPRLRPRRAPPAAAPSLVPVVAGAAVGLARAGLRLSRRPLLPSLRPPGRPWLPGPCVGASGAAPPPGRAWGPHSGPFFGSGPGRASFCSGCRTACGPACQGQDQRPKPAALDRRAPGGIQYTRTAARLAGHRPPQDIVLAF